MHYLHGSIFVWSVDGQVLHFWLVAGNRIAPVVLGNESLTIVARETGVAHRVDCVVWIQQSRYARIVIRF